METTKIIMLSFAGIIFTTCNKQSEREPWVDNALDVASCQLKLTADELDDSMVMPRSLWTGYDLNFLIEQMERPDSTFKDSLW